MMKNCWKHLVVLGLVSCAWIPGARVQADPTLEEKIENLLEDRHEVPTADQWRALGPQAPAAMISVYSKTRYPTHRARLLTGLGYFNDPGAVDFLKAQIRQSDRPSQRVMREAALQGLGEGAGDSQLEFIAEYLKDPAPSTRRAAARALRAIAARTQSEQARDLLAAAPAARELESQTPSQASVPLAGRRLPVLASSEDAWKRRLEGQWKGFRVGGVSESSDAALAAHASDLVIRSGVGQLTWEEKIAGKNPKKISWTLRDWRAIGPAGDESELSARAPSVELTIGLRGRTMEVREKKPEGAVWLFRRVQPL